MNKHHLFVIDPQNDFVLPTGTLPVPGAVDDMTRLATFVKRTSQKLAAIHVTMDSHRRTDISHPLWWVGRDGKHPEINIAQGKYPILVTEDDVVNGTWNCALFGRKALPGGQFQSIADYTLGYLRKLKADGKFPHVVWPEHCLIGTAGNNVCDVLMEALHEFESRPGRMVNYVTKGSNPFSEHFSVFRAQVPDPSDPSTQMNKQLADILQTADHVYIAGEAKSHCVASSIYDLADHLGDDSYLTKMTLLTDCMSNVPTFEAQGEKFVADMVKRGMNVAKSTDVLV